MYILLIAALHNKRLEPLAIIISECLTVDCVKRPTPEYFLQKMNGILQKIETIIAATM